MEPLQGPFSPASFGVVTADGDDNIIGEPMIVHCLVRSLCRLTANCVKGPVHLVQIDIRGQRTEWASLRNPELPPALMICFTRCKTCGSWTPFAILPSNTECRIVSK